MTTPTPSTATKSTKPRRRGLRRIVLGAVALVAVLLIAAALLAPAIASRMAPGIIQSAVNPTIRGEVQVVAVSVGWFSPTRVGPVRLTDDQQRAVGQLTLDTEISLWRALFGGLLSGPQSDLGTITLAGFAELVQRPDGSTNLSAALEPPPGTVVPTPAPRAPAPQPTTPPAPGRAIALTLALDGVKLTQRGLTESGTPAEPTGVDNLRGTLDLALDTRAGLSATAKGKLTGAPVGPGASAGAHAQVAIDVDADVVQGTAAPNASPLTALQRAKVNLRVTGAPVALIDALTNLGGALAASAGPTADIEIRADGTLRALTGLIDINAGDLRVNLPIAIADGYLTRADSAAPAGAASPATLRIASTRGLSLLPQLRELDTSLSPHVRVTDWPSLTVSLTSLRIPAPVDAAGTPQDLTTADLRGSSLALNVELSTIRGQVLVPQPDGPGAWKSFATEPVRFSLDIPDLSRGMEINQSLRATIDGQPAGSLTLRLAADGLLDSTGRLRAFAPAQQGAPASLGSLADRFEVVLALDGVSTPLLAPFAQASGLPLDLNADVGPTLSLELAARTIDATSAPAGTPAALDSASPFASLPPLRASLAARSANLNASADLELVRGVLAGAGEGVRATINAAAPLARRIAAPAEPGSPPLITSGTGRVELSVPRLRADLNKIMARGKDAPPIPADALALEATLALTDLGVSPTPDLAADVRSLNLRAVLPPRDPQSTRNPIPTFEVRSTLAHRAPTGAAKPFTAEGSFDLYGLARGHLPTGPWPDMLLGIRPTGTLTIAEAPAELITAIAGLNTAAATDQPASTLDTTQLATDLLGGSATATINLSYNDAQQAEFVRLLVSTPSQSLAVDAFAHVKRDRIIVPTFNAQVRADAALVNRILAPDAAAEGPRADGPVGARLALTQPIELPLPRSRASADAPETVSIDVARLSDVRATLTADPEPVLRTTLTSAEPGAAPRTIAVKVAGAQARIEVPAGALAPNTTKPVSVALAARALRAENAAPVANLTADVRHALDGSSTAVSAVIDQVSTAALDDVLALNGLLQGLAGETARVSLTTNLGDAQAAANRITASIDAPRIRGADITLVRDAQRFALASPATITLTPDVAFLNNALLKRQESRRPAEPARRTSGSANPLQQIGEAISGGRPAAAAAPADTIDRLFLTAVEPITLRINALALAVPAEATDSAPATGPFKPGVFALDTVFESRQVAVEVTPFARDGRPAGAPVRTAFSNLRGGAKLGTQGGLRLNTTFDQLSAGRPAGQIGEGGGSRFEAVVSRFADEHGNLTTDAMRFSADADVREFPTPVLDTLANQGGLASEALGPTISLTAAARQVSLTSEDHGTLDLRAVSPRADLELKGKVVGGRFVQTGPTTVRLLEIRPQLITQLAGSVPVVDSLEKSREDQPAVISATNLQLPLDGDLSQLNGTLSIDPGVARFTTTNAFGQLLKAVGGRQQGAIGRRIEPFIVTARSGVLEYERFTLPLGEFNLQTQGQVDLVKREMRVTTYAPFFAVAEEALGPIRLGLAGRIDLIDRNTLVPITTRGSLDNPRTSIDAETFIKDIGSSLIKNPLENIGGALDDLFGGRRRQPEGDKK
ncbi:MAG: hypothetical protein KF768_04075 [Phycisphaeraceae bacterium]|nr:hypothetical protein [Phycisphaeraceae bacterium]